jgi:hypothetical protein
MHRSTDLWTHPLLLFVSRRPSLCKERGRAVARLICWPSVIPCSFPNSRPHATTRATEKRGQREIEREGERGRRREGVQRSAKQRKGSFAGGVPCGARCREERETGRERREQGGGMSRARRRQAQGVLGFDVALGKETWPSSQLGTRRSLAHGSKGRCGRWLPPVQGRGCGPWSL